MDTCCTYGSYHNFITIEIPINQIESVYVNQNILGRILKFGDIDVIGTGGTNQCLKYIARIMSFKKSI